MDGAFRTQSNLRVQGTTMLNGAISLGNAKQTQFDFMEMSSPMARRTPTSTSVVPAVDHAASHAADKADASEFILKDLALQRAIGICTMCVFGYKSHILQAP